jgi:FkbM family methyltransferase
VTQALSFIVRSIPENQTKAAFVKHSLLLKGHRFNFAFKSHQAGIMWTASAFPDLLTRHMMFEGMYQQDVLVVLRALVRPGDTVFDVGGHHGLMALVSSVATGPRGTVVTFEPNPYARRQLQAHLAINEARNVVVEAMALSDRDDHVSFYVQTGHVTWNSTIVEKFATWNSRESLVVRTVPLDDYVTRSRRVPNVIKIDVEGSEFLVLEGARNTLREHRPVLIMEFNPSSAAAAGHAISDYVRFLHEETYALSVLKRDFRGYYKFSAQEPFDEARHTTEKSLVNVICVPRPR